jgi:4-diphosphocytidyl-2-C-methyl-D-erythritol kinase
LAQLSLPSFAKINWTLRILGKRPDGFHQVSTIYQTVELEDTISVETTTSPAVEITVTGRTLDAGEDNLVSRAATHLKNMTGCTSGAKIHLRKRIPIEAGLGGGSSNAAITLLGLNQLWKCSLGTSALQTLASDLGSDVPFFLTGGTALGWGRGTEIYPLPDELPRIELLLFYPGFGISAREAYEAGEWDTYRDSGLLTTEMVETTMRRLQQALDPSQDARSYLENDFEEILCDRYPALSRAHQLLKDRGYEHVMLCGSGSTLFGVNRVHETGVMKTSLEQEGESFFCSTLSRRRYRELLMNSGLLLG